MRLLQSLFILLASLLIAGCIDEISLDIPVSQNVEQLVVDGQIHAGPGPYTIRLERTAGLGLGETIPVKGAKGLLANDRGQQEALQELGEGKYQIPGNTIQGTVGDTYVLEIEVDNQLYRSRPEKLPAPVEIARIHWQQTNKISLSSENVPVSQPIVELTVDTAIPDRPLGPYLRWVAFETYSLTENPPPPPGSVSLTCFFTFPTNPQSVLLFDGDKFSGSTWENQWVGDREIDWTFSSKHVFSVAQISMTQNAYSYWSKVKRVIEQQGSIFDPPPALVTGNMSNVQNPSEAVLGYFAAVAIDTMHIFTQQTDFDPSLVQPICVSEGIYDPTQPPVCTNCRLLEGASLQRPYFF